MPINEDNSMQAVLDIDTWGITDTNENNIYVATIAIIIGAEPRIYNNLTPGLLPVFGLETRYLRVMTMHAVLGS